ncbi:MAG: bifunctional (p)ppGpp synthetase/guanosine-3',5'-bis(diphosphate) 3'-pyrophosphohydrolase [Oscillospiraceae bacterium]|nr:bifunctional (p)ppGpp synthetase/guanosine-3',5'-bis(diphosphate) 3'-pyrophosphohydrolase [Oscillospiraceae bacterium]MBQ9109964.1 bifunctional (p)ppGpp synthetase/guanosine-3',5'-bis(diphosphate) 3'-pyrophosphohydrolase [Oscillospiraceae bacterium]
MDDNVVTIDELVQLMLTNDKQYDLTKVISAYEFAAKAHEGQFRSSGQPYIIHPLAVAKSLLELGMDTDTVCAALLHDVVEDTEATQEDLQERFGRTVAMLVEGVTKLKSIPMFNKEQQQAENVRKMMLAMSKDIRVIIIKLCDRLHNMHTLGFRPVEKQKSTAHETMHIYVPLANRLGIRKVKDELEDLSFYYLDYYAYSEIENILQMKRGEREAFISSIKEQILDRLKHEKFVTTPEISGRVKSPYSIYRKIYIQHKEYDQIFDKYAVRIIVSTEIECYQVLGIIHEMYRPLPNRFKDYISMPKSNMYQSLHTTVLGREGIPFEVQIRTWDMHWTAEYGIAAHWKYKEGVQHEDKMDQRLSWIRQALELQQSSDDVEEIVSIIKNDIAPEDIYVMTPKGDTIALPVGANAIDFAYRIHTQIGHKTIGAKVDRRIVPLDYELQTGQIVEILTSKDPEKGPNRAWLEIAKTNEAKSKIRSWFKKEKREENIVTGRSMLEKEFRRNKIRITEEQLEEFLADDLKRHNCGTLEDFFASIGYGGIILSKLMPRWKDLYHKNYLDPDSEPEEQPIIKPVRSLSSNPITLDDISDCAVKFAQCCNPLPGDEIVGFITRGHGISVHTTSCTNYRSMLGRDLPEEKERWVEVQWTDSSDTAMQTGIEVIANDRVGLVYDISAILTEARIPIVHSSSHILKNGNAVFDASIRIVNKSQLTAVFDRIRRIKGVISVERAQNS